MLHLYLETFMSPIPWLFSVFLQPSEGGSCVFLSVISCLYSQALSWAVMFTFSSPSPYGHPELPSWGQRRWGIMFGFFSAWLCLVHMMQHCPQDVMVSVTFLQAPSMWENILQAVRGFSVALRRVEEFSLAGNSEDKTALLTVVVCEEQPCKQKSP